MDFNLSAVTLNKERQLLKAAGGDSARKVRKGSSSHYARKLPGTAWNCEGEGR